MIEYLHYDHFTNKSYWKIVGLDTLYFELGGEKRETEVDSSISTRLEYNTDTILGYKCNRFIIVTSTMKLTFIYSPELAVDPSWYQYTKIGYYDLIYGHTRAYYLESIVENKGYISKMIAQNVIARAVSENEFPDLNKVLLSPM